MKYSNSVVLQAVVKAFRQFCTIFKAECSWNISTSKFFICYKSSRIGLKLLKIFYDSMKILKFVNTIPLVKLQIILKAPQVEFEFHSQIFYTIIQKLLILEVSGNHI